MPEQPTTTAALSEHCYTPSWCKCPDEPKCQLCKQGRCPVEPETSTATRCCNGTCRRKASPPPMVMRSELTGTWWVVMRYKDLGEGRFEALEKHMLADDSAQQLEEMRSRLPVYADEEPERRTIADA